MKTMEVTRASASLVATAGRSRDRTLILTRKGKPLAAVVSLRGLAREAFALSTDPRFLALVERSEESARRDGTVSFAEVCRGFGITREDLLAARSRRGSAASASKTNRRP